MTKAVQQNAFPARFAVVFEPRITRSNTNAAAGGSPRRPLEIGDVRETQPVLGRHAAGEPWFQPRSTYQYYRTGNAFFALEVEPD